MKVLIVGAGFSGLTLAAFLEGSNVEYEIIDKSKSVHEGGFVLVAWDNVRDILKKLGLADQFDTFGIRIRNYYIRNGKGQLLRNYDLRDFYLDYGTGITMLGRENLRDWLLTKVKESKITTGLSIEKIIQKDSGVEVLLSNQESRRYDILVGADGIHSCVRSLEFQKDAEKYENWRCWWVWIPNQFNSPATITEYIEPGENVLIFSAGAKSLAILIAPAEHTLRDSPEGRLARMKEIFKDEHVLMPEALQGLQDKDLMPSDLIDVEMKNSVKGRVVLIGDAAHSFGPHAGLGAGMAMEDAYVLAAELMRISNHYSVEKALANYEKKRKPRVRTARRVSEKMRLWTLIKSQPLRKIVNVCVKFMPESFFVEDYNKLLKEEI